MCIKLRFKLLRSLFTLRYLLLLVVLFMLFAKSGENHIFLEEIITPSAFHRTVLEKDDKDVKTIPLSNNTVSSRTEEMGEKIETQLAEKLKSRQFSAQMDE